MLFRNDKKDSRDSGGAATPLRVPLLPLRDIIVLPQMVVPLFVGRQKSIRALEEAMNAHKAILLAAQRDAKTNDPTEEDIYQVGTLGSLVQLLRLPNQRGQFDAWACGISYPAAQRLRELLRLGPVTLHADIDCALFAGQGQNLLATFPGRELPEEAVYFIAHTSAATCMARRAIFSGSSS